MYKKFARPYGVVIGRFQPFHNGHLHLVKKSLEISKKKVCIVLGSAKKAPDPKNPWTPKMREEMIRSCFSKEDNDRLVFVSVRDYKYNLTMWLTDVRSKVLDALECEDNKISLYGYFKDQSSFYLGCFPNWQVEEVSSVRLMNATDVRAEYFTSIAGSADTWAKDLPVTVWNHLIDYSTKPIYQELAKEFAYYEKYKKDTKFVGQPWAPTFLTADSVVIQSGHLLLIKRKIHPGKGLYALPGGFLSPSETLEQAAIRELKEETGIILSSETLKSYIKEGKLFDDPGRSLRGRTVTYAVCIVLPDNLEKGLPKVRGNDDADSAFWMPVADLYNNEDIFFEDHLDIISYFVRKL